MKTTPQPFPPATEPESVSAVVGPGSASRCSRCHQTFTQKGFGARSTTHPRWCISCLHWLQQFAKGRWWEQ